MVKMLSTSDDLVAEQIVKACSVSGKDRLYVLGTRGKRVNFTAQQNRAMNLVWALRHKQILKPDTKVGIVGGGLSGITCAASLVDGASEVSLFERRPEVLYDQLYTQHRYIHPTINFWPEQQINPSTNFPFFDWAAGLCSEVMKDISREWKLHFSHKVNVHVASQVNRIEKAGKQYKLSYETPTGNIWSNAFDVVVLALGFGDEKDIKGVGTPSYWEPDTLNRTRGLQGSRILICGTGDGGLIDLFRASFNAEFDFGRLIADFANQIAKTSVAEEIATLELQANGMSDEDASVQLATGYRRIIKSIKNSVSLKLQRNLQHGIKGRITLVGPYSSPYSKNSAPVHKLLLAFLSEENLFEYRAGKINGASNGIAKFSNKTKPVQFDLLIPRIGSTHNVNDFRKFIDIEKLHLIQDAIADITFVPQWKTKKYYLLSGKTTRNAKDKHFLSDRAQRARKRIRDLFPGIENISYDVENGNPILIAELAPNVDVGMIPNFPDRLFGIPTSPKPTNWMDVL